MVDPWLTAILAKMAATAFIVVSASVIAERSSSLIAAMVATLPVSAGPVYVFLALEHDAAFIGQAALGSMGASVAAWLYCVAYVRAAQNLGTVPSVGLALLAWFATAFVLKQAALPVLANLLLMMAVFGASLFLTRPYLLATPLSPTARTWYALPVRAVAVALLVAAVTSISASIGPDWSGLLATFPIVLSSLAVILQPRIGGPATAAAMANAVPGLFGLGLGLVLVHMTAVPLGSALALLLGLGVSILWNLGLIWRSRKPRTR